MRAIPQLLRQNTSSRADSSMTLFFSRTYMFSVRLIPEHLSCQCALQGGALPAEHKAHAAAEDADLLWRVILQLLRPSMLSCNESSMTVPQQFVLMARKPCLSTILSRATMQADEVQSA